VTPLPLLLLLAAPQPAWSKMDEAQRAAEVAKVRSLDPSQRMVALSKHFLGTPYGWSPLGEGQGKDADPLIRYDEVDCQTMVEELMAMATAKDEASLLPTLNAIRYHGAPSFDDRNHLMEAQWLPANLEAGRLKDVTRKYGGADTVREVKKLTRRTWLEKEGKKLGVSPAAQVTGSFPLELIPAEKAVEKLKDAPSGLVVVVARADRPWLVTRVTHMALLLHTDQGPMLRHASRSHKKVVDEKLASYVKRNRDYGLWTVTGFAVFEVTEPKR